jgi:hypothetical protein
MQVAEEKFVAIIQIVLAAAIVYVGQQMLVNGQQKLLG